MNNIWKVIINPFSGDNLNSTVWERIIKGLKDAGIEFEYEISQYHLHIIKMVRQSLTNGFQRFIIIGGDGSLNEAVNGIYSQNQVAPADIITAHFSLGTGNDWQRTHNLPAHYPDMIELIKAGNTSFQDVGVATFKGMNGNKINYFVNVAGMGFDAYVVKRTARKSEKKRSSKFSYLFALLRSLISYQCSTASVSVDGNEVFSGKLFSLCTGIGKFNGGGMMQLPDAISNDGLLDVTIIRKVSKIKVLANVKNLYDGSFKRLKEVSMFKGTQVKVSADAPLALECDGELPGQSPVTFNIIPAGFRFIC